MIGPAEILKASILIVDDQEANVALLEQMLRGAGYDSISSTRNPREVCELHRMNRYDLILLDLQMPGMDGFQVMEGLKEIETGSYLPVLVITAQPDHKLRALKAGAKDFVSKPFDLAEVLIRVYNMIEVRLLQQELMIHNFVRLENSQRIAGLGDWECDSAHHHMVWSEGLYRLLGVSRKDAPPNAETLGRLVHPDDLAFVQEVKKAAAAGSRRVDFEHRLIRPDGEVRHIHQITETVLDDQGRPVRESGTMQDITERKLTEEALRQSEERYRMMFERNPTPVWVFDHATFAFLAVNDAAIALYGYSRKEFLRMTVLEIRTSDVVPSSLERTVAAHAQSRAPGRTQHRKKDGTIFPVDILTHEIEFAGQPARLVLVVDMTETERAAAALRTSEARFRALSESAPLGIFECDAAGRVVYSNPALIALTGRPAGDSLGRGWEENIHPEDRAAMSAGWARAAAEGSAWDKELRLLRPDGSVRWVHTLTAPGKDAEGRITGFVGTVEDITERRVTEVAMLESEERFKFVARAVSDVVWDWNLSANTLWWNDGFLTTFGFVAGEIEPSVEAWTSRIHPDERSRVVDSIHRAIDAGTELWNAEYRFQRKDGSYAFVQDRGYILRTAAGKAVRMVGGMRDLTEQKKMEAQYLRALRMESIGTLAGGIAHDLNNVLTPIMMAIELLKLNLGNDPRRIKILDTIEVNSRRGADLVRQVLSFARGLYGQRVAIRLRPLINELKGIISETFPRNIRIVSDVPADLWPIAGDPTQIHQVLLNLAVNARDAMPHGGTLTLAAANLTIDAQYAGTSQGSKTGRGQEAKAGPHVLLQVTDTGVGIPPEVRERIFEPFFTTKELGHGTGIGLATVHTIVKSHGGFLNVESEVGLGTTFKIFLPADPTLRADKPEPAPAELPRGRDELVLAVDDEFSIRDITKQTLEAFGYRVITANDGAEAVALYAKHVREIAVVLTDMMMPIMDGAATIQVLMRINPAVKIIAASGVDSGDTVAKATNAGVKHFLPKPYTAETLLKLLREVIDQPAGTESPSPLLAPTSCQAFPETVNP
jgi:PAS domain S-box-containing protein